MVKGFFITPQGLTELQNYKYVSGGYSWLDLKINPFWEAVASVLPLWLAPNLVTFIGFVMVVISMVLVMVYDLTFRGIVPGWVFFVAGINVFIYMTLDAVDGKQARRTKSSSPLGQLFDHGCDSFTVGLITLMFLEASHLQFNWVFYALVNIQAIFYIASLKEKHTGVLITHIWNMGVTEIQLIIIGCYFLTAIYGQSYWQNPIVNLAPAPLHAMLIQIPYAEWVNPLHFLKFLNVVFTIQVTYVFINMLFTIGADALLGMLPLFWLQMLELVFFLMVDFFQDYGILVLLGFILLLSMIVTKLIICSLTKMEFRVWHWQLMVATLMTFGVLGLQRMGLEKESKMLFGGWFIVNILIIIRFEALTIRQITHFLGIHCFKIGKHSDLKQ